jgi:hypothetical protein
MARTAGVKFQGRDARVIFFKGGGETLIRYLCPQFVSLQTHNFSKLDSFMDKIIAIDNEATGVKQKQRALLKELAGLKSMDVDDKSPEEFSAALGDIFDWIIANDSDEQFEHLRGEAITCGTEVLEVFQKEDIIGIDDETNECLEIFKSLNAIVKPICVPCSDNTEQLLADMAGHNERVKDFIKLLNKYNFKFGEKSDYMHWLVFHAKEECERVILKWGLHLSHFSCQTSEHFNKILKRIVEKLHGFTKRPVSQQFPWKNKFGYIMQQFQLRFFHFYESFQSSSSQKCSRCSGTGHNRRSCTF